MMRLPGRLPLALCVCLLTGSAADGEGPVSGKGAPPAPNKSPSPPPSSRNIGGPGDYGLREKLLQRLASEPGLARAGWKLILVNGGAVFSGTVPTWSMKQRALVMAGLLRGIVNVTDQIQVPRGDVPDEQIVAAVSALLGDRKDSLGVQALEVEVQEGVLTLSGTVKDFAARVRAEELAGTVGGVTKILNRLRPADAPSGSGDPAIRKAVASYLGDFRSYPYRCELQVKVKDAEVTLTGRVPYYLARQQAGAMTALVGGVKSVDNRIKVDPSTTEPVTSVKELP